MKKPLRVLIVEDSADDALIVERRLNKGGYEVISKRVESAEAMRSALTAGQTWDVILCDYDMPCFDAPAALGVVKDLELDIPFIIISGKVGEELAVASMKAGAHDFLTKDNLVRLVPALERELREAEVRRERVKSQKERAIWEAKFRLLAESIDDAVWICDPDSGEVLYVNPAYERIWGKTCENAYRSSTSYMESMHPDDRERFLRSVESLGESTACTDEYRIVRDDGSVRWVHHRAFPVRDEQGKLGMMAVVATDISLRKQTEEALLASQKTLRHLSDKLLSAQEEERKRIAGELHDSIGQNFLAVKVTIRNALSRLNKGKVEQAAALLEQLLPVVKEAIEETRLISTGLRPAVLDNLGILATIRWFTDGIRELYPNRQLEVTTRIKEKDIAEELKITIFRIVQEALQNVTKHSLAESVSLSLAQTNGRIELTIEDDGVGFDPMGPAGADNKRGGMGLTSMRERVELSGGAFSVDSGIGTGTRIVASWPHLAGAAKGPRFEP